jgi:hypothetical protein
MAKKLITNKIKFSWPSINMIAINPILLKNLIPMAPRSILTEFSLLISNK